MAARIATLEVLASEKLIEKAAHAGERLFKGLAEMTSRYEFLGDVRGNGLMIGIEFRSPRSLKLKIPLSALVRFKEGFVLSTHHNTIV